VGSILLSLIVIAAAECSFLTKSGKHTDELGMFDNSAHEKAEKGKV
jgi:hypothetical protein